MYFGSCFTPKGAIVIDWVLLKDWARQKETKNACRTFKIHLVDVMIFLTTCVSKETLDANLVQNSGEYRLTSQNNLFNMSSSNNLFLGQLMGNAITGEIPDGVQCQLALSEYYQAFPNSSA